MKTVLFFVAGAVLTVGAAHLGGHEPKCPLGQMLKSEKTVEAVKADKSVTAKK